MDILLVNSVEFVKGNDSPQIGQLILRKILRQKYETDYVNFDYLNTTGELCFQDTYEKCIELFAYYICEKKPIVVGFYTLCDSFITTVLIAEKVKKTLENVKIVFGGPHASMVARECLDLFDYVDVISIGEAEYTILPLMDALITGKTLDAVLGIAYRRGDDVVINECPDIVPAYELNQYTEFDYSPYKFKQDTRVMIEAGRGCPYRCDFCSTSVFWKKRYRILPPRMLVENIKKFYINYGIKKFSLQHDMLTGNRHYIFELCNKLIEEQLDIEWACSARIDCLDIDMLWMMKNAGCSSIFLGIETGSPRMQKQENKNLDLNKSLEMVYTLIQMNFEVTVSFIYGYPDETIDDLLLTLEMIEKLFLLNVHNVQLHKYTILPLTKDAKKVAGSIYFKPENATEMSILYRSIFKKENIRTLVANNPEVFMHYYTFDTKVRERYGDLDMFWLMMLSLAVYYGGAIRFLIRTHGISNLYLKYKHMVTDMFEQNNVSMEHSFFSENVITNMMLRVKKILELEYEHITSEAFRQLMQFETLIYDVTHSKENEINKVYQFSFDVVHMHMSGEEKRIDSYIKIEKKGKSVKVSKLKVSCPLISC